MDGDLAAGETSTSSLRQRGLDVTWAVRGQDGLAAARHTEFHVLLIDVQLPDMSGLDIIRYLQAEEICAPFVIVSGEPTVRVVVEAMRLGAVNVFPKPMNTDEFLTTLHVADSLTTRAEARPAPEARDTERLASRVRGVTPERDGSHGSALERWALLVCNAIHAEQDPRTISGWARAVGVSRSTIAEICRLVHISPHDARDLARLLRAVCRVGPTWEPEVLLDCADARTLKKLMARAGLTQVRGGPAPTVRELLKRQQWIAPDSAKWSALAALLLAGEPSDRPGPASRFHCATHSSAEGVVWP